MKYIKVIVGLGLIPLGIFVGSHISLGGGSEAILGGILGVILCCVLIGFRRRGRSGSWPGSASLDEQYQVMNNVNKQEIDKTLRSMQEAHLKHLPHRLPDVPSD